MIKTNLKEKIFESGIDIGSSEIKCTIVEIDSINESVKLIDNPENIGCHPSQLVGWNSSDADVLYMLPSDRQIPPNSIPELIMNLKNNDIVWTNRVPRNDPYFRRIVSFFYNFIS